MNPLLSRQGKEGGRYWSLIRDNQLRRDLEPGLDAALGHGVVSGGLVVVDSGYTGHVVAPTTWFDRGKVFTITDDAAFTANVAPGGGSTYVDVWLWCWWVRTAANQANITDLDTYALTFGTSLNDTPPAGAAGSATPMAILRNSATGIHDVGQCPDGKTLRTADLLRQMKLIIPATEVAVLPADEQALVRKLSVRGRVGVHGLLSVGR